MLLRRAIPLIREFRDGRTQTQTAANLEWSRQLVSYWANRLEDAGYLRSRGRWGGFDLLQPAVALLRKFDACATAPMIRHEHGGWKYKVIEREKKPIVWRKVKNVHNWDDYVHREKFKGIVRKVELHERTKDGTQLLIYSGPVMGDTDEELIVLARQSCDLLAAHLQDKFDMRLDMEHPKSIRPQVGEWVPEISDPFVKEFVRANGQIRTRDFNMDDSPRTGGEIDFKGKRGAELAIRYVKGVTEIPQLRADIKVTLKSVEDTMVKVSNSMTTIAETIDNSGKSTQAALEKFMETLTKAISENNSQPKVKPPDPRRYM